MCVFCSLYLTRSFSVALIQFQFQFQNQPARTTVVVVGWSGLRVFSLAFCTEVCATTTTTVLALFDIGTTHHHGHYRERTSCIRSVVVRCVILTDYQEEFLSRVRHFFSYKIFKYEYYSILCGYHSIPGIRQNSYPLHITVPVSEIQPPSNMRDTTCVLARRLEPSIGHGTV